MNMYTLRLKTEEKKMSQGTYSPAYVHDIMLSVHKAAKKYSIDNYIFESAVKTTQGRLTYCHFKMSELIFKFFCKSYGSRHVLEKDYQVTEHK